jgi:hypothetical protein
LAADIQPPSDLFDREASANITNPRVNNGARHCLVPFAACNVLRQSSHRQVFAFPPKTG